MSALKCLIAIQFAASACGSTLAAEPGYTPDQNRCLVANPNPSLTNMSFGAAPAKQAMPKVTASSSSARQIQRPSATRVASRRDICKAGLL